MDDFPVAVLRPTVQSLQPSKDLHLGICAYGPSLGRRRMIIIRRAPTF